MKKLVSLALVGCMVFSLAACGNNTATTGGVETEKSVVATFNGKEITREDVGVELTNSEMEIIKGYLATEAINEFFKDVEVTDTEIQTQMDMIKVQVGEEQWPMYLMYYGGGTEETFKVMLEQSLRQEKYISERSNSIELSDEELNEVYSKNPSAYDIAVLDVVFFGEFAQVTKAKELYAEGKTLEEIAEDFALEVSPNEHTYIDSEGLSWDKDLATCEVGDIVFSAEDSGSYFVGRVKQINKGLENKTVRDDLVASLTYEKAFEEVNKEYEEFLKEQKFTILGTEVKLVEDEHVHTEDGTEVIDAPVVE